MSMVACQKTNFFILGAPKCGTTALATYLGSHPNLFMSDPKEPAFWATDYPDARLSQAVSMQTLADYETLFEDQTSQHQVIGEATALYLSSRTAVPAIMEYNPASKFLVMLRNPLEFATAFHHEMLYRTREEVEDFETAWRLQDERLAGRRLPKGCNEPSLLNYKAMGQFGQQLQRVTDIVPAGQLQVVFLEDLRSNPRAVYCDALRFLNLDDDGRVEFPVVNSRKAPRWRALNRLYYANQGPMGAAVKFVRKHGKRIAPVRAAWSAVRSKPQTKSALGAGLREEMRDAFRDDIRLLAALTNRDLSHWLAN